MVPYANAADPDTPSPDLESSPEPSDEGGAASASPSKEDEEDTGAEEEEAAHSRPSAAMLAAAAAAVDVYTPQSGPLPADTLERVTHSAKILRKARKPAGEREVIQRRQKKTEKEEHKVPHLTSPHLTSPHLTSPHITHTHTHTHTHVYMRARTFARLQSRT